MLVDARILERDLQGAGALEDLGDVDDVGTGFATGERLGHPRDGEVGGAVGELLLRHDLDRSFEHAHVEAVLLVDPHVGGGEVAGEL